MTQYELSHPRGSGHQLSASSTLDQLQVLSNGALRVHVHVQIAQVLLDERYAAGKAVATVHNFVDAHFRYLAFVVGIVDRCLFRDVSPEVERLGQTGVPLLSGLHVGVNFRYGYDHVEAKGENDPGHQHDKCDKRRVLEVGDLQLSGPEFDPPANRGVYGRRFEAHRLPVGRLDVFEVVRISGVVALNLLLEQDERIAYEQVSYVVGEMGVYTVAGERAI